MILDDCAVYEPASETLILADLHLDYPVHPGTGADEGSVVSPSLLPRYRALLDRYDPQEVVIAGDLFETTHEPPVAAAEAFTDICDMAYDRAIRVVVTPGNHERVGVDLVHMLPEPSTPEYRLSDGASVVLHGNRVPSEEAERFIIGHMHPMMEVDSKRLPTYLIARDAFRDADVWVLPPFNRRVRGVPLHESLAGKPNAPVIRRSTPLDGDQTSCVGWDTETNRSVSRTLSEIGLA